MKCFVFRTVCLCARFLFLKNPAGASIKSASASPSPLLTVHPPLLKKQLFRPALASAEDMTQFHSDEYVEFLRLITPDNQHEHMRQLKRFNCAEDCPVFDGLFNFCQVRPWGFPKSVTLFNAPLRILPVIQRKCTTGNSYGVLAAVTNIAQVPCFISQLVTVCPYIAQYSTPVLADSRR